MSAVFVHGHPETASIWRPLLALLAEVDAEAVSLQPERRSPVPLVAGGHLVEARGARGTRLVKQVLERRHESVAIPAALHNR